MFTFEVDSSFAQQLNVCSPEKLTEFAIYTMVCVVALHSLLVVVENIVKFYVFYLNFYVYLYSVVVN